MKDSPAAPPAPDYNALAATQGQQNIDAARTQARLNNANIVNPYGSQSVIYGTPQFDQTGYDRAMAAYSSGQPMTSFDQAGYDKAMADYTQASTGSGSGVPQYILEGQGQQEDLYYGGNYVANPAYRAAGAAGPAPDRSAFTKTTPFSPNGAAPDRAAFTTYGGNMDVPTVTQTLSPEQQKLFDQQTALSQQLGAAAGNQLTQATNAMAQPFDTSRLTQRGAAPTIAASAQGPTVQGQTAAAQYGAMPKTSQFQGMNGTAQYQNMNGTANYQDASGVSQYGNAPDASRFQNFNQTVQYNTPLASADSASADRVARAMYMRAAIPLAYQNQLQTNQAMVGGHNLGGSAMNAMADNQNRGWNDLALASIGAGGAEQSRLFALQQATQQAADTRQNSLYSQGIQNAGFNNANAQALYNQQMGIAQLGDTRQNTQQAQGFQNLQANNANQTNLYNQQLQNAGFNNTNATNIYNQQFQNTGLDNQNAANLYAQQMQQSALGDTRANANFAQTEAAKQSLYNQQLQAAQFQDAQNLNQFNQGAQLFGMQGQARAQDMQEQAYLRSLPLSELNALRTGSQPTMPNFPAYGGGGNVQAAPTMQGGTLGYQAALGPYNAQLASNQITSNGLFSLAGTALGAYFGGPAGAAAGGAAGRWISQG